MMFLGLRKLGNICCGHKMFQSKIRNILCVPVTKFVSATNVARAGKQEKTFVSATMHPQQCVLVCQGLNVKCLKGIEVTQPFLTGDGTEYSRKGSYVVLRQVKPRFLELCIRRVHKATLALSSHFNLLAAK